MDGVFHRQVGLADKASTLASRLSGGGAEARSSASPVNSASSRRTRCGQAARSASSASRCRLWAAPRTHTSCPRPPAASHPLIRTPPSGRRRAHPLPRRADLGHGPALSPRHLGAAARGEARADGRADDALPRRGGAALLSHLRDTSATPPRHPPKTPPRHSPKTPPRPFLDTSWTPSWTPPRHPPKSQDTSQTPSQDTS